MVNSPCAYYTIQMDELNKNQNESLESGSRAQKPTIERKTFLITLVVFLVLLSALWIWKSVEIRNLKKAAETRQNELQQQASRELVSTHEEHLKLLAKPFVWAVRSEMMRDNMSQVNLYMSEMVREKNFELVALVNEKGMIISSTNKKNEGQPFSTIGKSSDLYTDNTNLQTEQNSMVSMTSPVMGFNNRLGTLFIKYRIPDTAYSTKK